MTTGTAENLASRGTDKKEEKVEKRRALGRGLESLLPGPRGVVSPSDPRQSTGQQANKDHMPSLQAATAESPVIMRSAESIRATQEPPLREQIARNENIVSISAQESSANVVVSLSLHLIDKNPYQTRQLFHEDQLAELRDSIRKHGVVQPVVVRPASEDGRYILVLGERRLRASKMAGKQTIPALVRRLSPQQAAEMTVLENVQREDLNPIEQAEAFRVLSKEFHLTQAQIAERIGVSRETVANYMRLLRLPQEVMGYLVSGRLSFSDCRELLALQNEEHILQVAQEVVTKHLKWDEIEDRVARLNGFIPGQPGSGESQKQARGARWMDPNVRAAQTEMERTLGMRVRIKDRNGKGKIVIEYATVDDFDRVVEMFKAR